MAEVASGISIAPERFDRELLAEVARAQPDLTARSLPDASVEDDGVGDPVSDDETDIAPTTAAYKVNQPRRPGQVSGLDRKNSPHPRRTQAAAREAQEARVEDAEIFAIHDRTMPTIQVLPWLGVGLSFLASSVKPPPPPPDDGRWRSLLPPPPFEV